jgi:hypothetical protein
MDRGTVPDTTNRKPAAMKRKPEKPIQAFKEKGVRKLPKETGVYALCDLDGIPIYVGRSTDGIRARVRRHLTSARSDVIANRQIDVWEVAFVWAWRVENVDGIAQLEAFLFHQFHAKSPLVNGDIPRRPGKLGFEMPEEVRVQVIPDEEIAIRLAPMLRFPRQILHFGQLVDYILHTQDKPHLRQALKVYFDRLTRYYEAFLAEEGGS